MPLDVPDESIQAAYDGRIAIWGLTEDDLMHVLEWAEYNYGFALLDYVDAPWSAQSLKPVRKYEQRVDSAQRVFESIMETKINGKKVIKGGLN